MKKIKYFFLLLIILFGCSANTLYTIDFDLLTLLDDPNSMSGDLYIPGSIQAFLPDSDGNPLNPDGGYLINASPTFSDIHQFVVAIELEISNLGTSSISIALDLRLSNVDDANIYDQITDVSLAADSVILDPGDTVMMQLSTSLDSEAPKLSLIDPRGFRIGLMLSTSGSTTIHFQAESFRIIIKQRPFDLIPPP